MSVRTSVRFQSRGSAFSGQWFSMTKSIRSSAMRKT